jgi:hypothetical protein
MLAGWLDETSTLLPRDGCACGRIPSRINRARFDACRGSRPRLIMIT